MIFVLAGVAYAIYIMRDMYLLPEQSVMTVALTLIFTFLLICIFVCIAWVPARLIGVFIPKKWKVRRTVPLVSMRDGSGSRGEFFLGCGIFSSDRSYVFYEQLSDGGFEQRSVSANLAKIYEEDRADGELTEFDRVFVHPLFYLIAIPNIEYDDTTRFEFRIPKGSLRQEFSLS